MPYSPGVRFSNSTLTVSDVAGTAFASAAVFVFPALVTLKERNHQPAFKSFYIADVQRKRCGAFFFGDRFACAYNGRHAEASNNKGGKECVCTRHNVFLFCALESGNAEMFCASDLYRMTAW
jgi:hypothetical protein